MSPAWIRSKFLFGSSSAKACTIRGFARCLSHGWEIYLHPFDSIGMTVFVAELTSQLKARNIDVDRLGAHRSCQAGTNLPTKEAIQALAKDIAQHIQSMLPTYSIPDPSSQQRILALEAELAKVRGQQGLRDQADKSLPSTPPPSASMPIVDALQGRAPPPKAQHLFW